MRLTHISHRPADGKVDLLSHPIFSGFLAEMWNQKNLLEGEYHHNHVAFSHMIRYRQSTNLSN